MRIVVNQPAGTQLFFNIEEPKDTTIRQIAQLVEDEEGIPASYQLYSAGEECWATPEESLANFMKGDNTDIIELDVTYDLDGQGGVRCETAKPSCACHFCCCEARCIKKYDVFCCCCEVGCSIL